MRPSGFANDSAPAACGERPLRQGHHMAQVELRKLIPSMCVPGIELFLV